MRYLLFCMGAAAAANDQHTVRHLQHHLSRCEHTMRSPDHRYDPALLNVIAFGNDVAGADPGAPLEPIEAQCGTQ